MMKEDSEISSAHCVSEEKLEEVPDAESEKRVMSAKRPSNSSM
jgi:hypothetical protein